LAGRATRLNQTRVPQDEQGVLVGLEQDGARIVRRRVPASQHDLRLVDAPLDYLIFLLPCSKLRLALYRGASLGQEGLSWPSSS
jgi:hypothetical protein